MTWTTLDIQGYLLAIFLTYVVVTLFNLSPVSNRFRDMWQITASVLMVLGFIYGWVDDYLKFWQQSIYAAGGFWFGINVGLGIISYLLSLMFMLLGKAHRLVDPEAEADREQASREAISNETKNKSGKKNGFWWFAVISLTGIAVLLWFFVIPAAVLE